MRVALVKMPETSVWVSDCPDAYRDCDDVRKVEMTEAHYRRYWEARERYINELRELEHVFNRKQGG